VVTDTEQYLFDLNGYYIVKGALTPEQVVGLNALIDRERLDGPGNQHENITAFHKVLLQDHHELRDLIDNPRILPYLHKWVARPAVSKGSYPPRLDMTYFIFADKGTLGGDLHLGGTPYVPACSYHVEGGDIFSALTVVSYALSESAPPGLGGFACIPGSHKSKFPCPAQYANLSDLSCVACPSVEPGDAIIFTEALTHGTLPWKAEHQRRVLFYKYSPMHMAFMHPRWSERLLEICSPEQREMLRSPQMMDSPDYFS